MVTTAARADVIYLEDFTGELNKGYIGPDSAPTLDDTTGVTWTIDVSGGNFTANSDFMVVTNPTTTNELFDVLDPGGPTSWYSPIIDISSYNNVQVAFDVSTPSTNIDETAVDWQAFYSIDGGAEVEFFDADDIWGPTASLNDFIPTGTFSSGVVPVGSTVQIRVLTNSNNGTIRMRWDNVTVTGDLIPEPASMALLAAGLALIGVRRRGA